MVKLVGLSLQDAVKMATVNPARIIKEKKKGILAEGKDADLVVFDDELNIFLTMVEGRIIFSLK